MKKLPIAAVLFFLSCFLIVTGVLAQGEQLRLGLSRDFGYSGFSGDIQGLFSMKVTGPADLVRVVFYIDGDSIGEDKRAPFRLQFNTDNYPLGNHQMSAVGYSSSGLEYRSNVINAKFVPASEGTKVVIPILAIVFGLILVSAVISLVTGRQVKNLPPGTQRQYPSGGAICPKCGRPFAFHFLGLNLVGSKLDRCPYCGKWSLVRYASKEQLRAAEQAELEGAEAQVSEAPEEEKLKKELDDSKYQGL